MSTNPRALRISVWLLPIVAVVYVMTLAFAVLPAKAYILGPRWTANGVAWRTSFQNGVATGPFPSSTYGNVVSAASKWSFSSTGKNFSFQNYNGVIGPVSMNVGNASFSALGWQNIPGNSVVNKDVNTGRLVSATNYLNSDWSWNTSCTFGTNQADVLTVILHEEGHSLDLQHDSSHPEAVMWPNSTCKHFLTTDDLNGIGALYP